MNNKIEMLVYDQKGSSPKVLPALQTHTREMLTREAEFAKSMIQMGMIAGMHRKRGNVEDMRLLTPALVVERACALAELAFAEFARRGWIVPMPGYEEMREQIERDNNGAAGMGFHQVNGQESSRR